MFADPVEFQIFELLTYAMLDAQVLLCLWPMSVGLRDPCRPCRAIIIFVLAAKRQGGTRHAWPPLAISFAPHAACPATSRPPQHSSATSHPPQLTHGMAQLAQSRGTRWHTRICPHRSRPTHIAALTQRAELWGPLLLGWYPTQTKIRLQPMGLMARASGPGHK